VLQASLLAEVAWRGMTYTPNGVQETCMDKIADWMAGGGKRWLMLSGLPGNGKTTVMRATVTTFEYLQKTDEYGDHISVKQVTARQINAAAILQDNYKIYNNIAGQKFLAIDDMGVEPVEVVCYGNVDTPVVDLLLYRYQHLLSTIVSTNLTPADIRAKYGDRIADRFNEMFNVVVFSNQTFRK